MKTEVIMKRQLFGKTISQKSKSHFFSATDLVKAGNTWRTDNDKEQFNMNNWLKTKSTKEFMAALEAKHGKIKINSRGKGQHTWVHPLLFIDMALAVSPELKIEVYEWLYDHLLAYRNSSGTSYKAMCGSLYESITDKSKFSKYIIGVCNQIQKSCNVYDWQEATEEQLRLRDKIHNNISLLSDVLRDNNQAVKLGIIKAKES